MVNLGIAKALGIAAGGSPPNLFTTLARKVERVREGAGAVGWSSRQALLLRAADELHATRRIGDELWAGLGELLDDAELIELCMLVGHYEMLAMTLNSLGVQIDRIPSGSAPQTARLPQAVAEEIRRAGGKVAHTGVADVSDHDAVVALATDVHAAHESMDVVMNIAGISTWGAIEQLEHHHWRRTIDINLMGPISVLEIVGVDRESPAIKALVKRFEGHAVTPEHVAAKIATIGSSRSPARTDRFPASTAPMPLQGSARSR